MREAAKPLALLAKTGACVADEGTDAPCYQFDMNGGQMDGKRLVRENGRVVVRRETIDDRGTASLHLKDSWMNPGCLCPPGGHRMPELSSA